MIDNRFEKGYAVEYLIFEVRSDLIDKFVELDHQYWTLFLKDQPGFISKEVWVGETNQGEISIIIYWRTLEDWQSIPVEALAETDKKFTAAFGEENFKMAKKVHYTENVAYKVREYSL